MLTAIAGPDSADTATLETPYGVPALSQPRDPAAIRIGVPRRAMADRPDFAAVMTQFEAVLSALSKAGVPIVDPCDLPSAEQLQDVRSSRFPHRVQGGAQRVPSRARPSLRDRLAGRAHPLERGASRCHSVRAVAVACRRGHGGAGRSAYRADRARDIVLSRSAGIDAAVAASGMRCADRTDVGRGANAPARRGLLCSPFRRGSTAPATRSVSRYTRREDTTGGCSMLGRRSLPSSAIAACRSSDRVTRPIACARGRRSGTRSRSRRPRACGYRPGRPRDCRSGADGRSATDAGSE